MQLFGAAVTSFGLCLLAIIALRPFAATFRLIDRPGGRKTHHGEVPIVGGLAMMLGIVLGFGFLPYPDEVAGSFLAGCALLVTVGLLDDRFNLSPWLRLPVHAAAALMLIFGTGTLVGTLGMPLGASEITLSGSGAMVFTVLIAMTAINAFNMLDGMDGLAGAMALVAFVALGSAALAGGALLPAATCLVFGGAVAAFLTSNVPLRFNVGMRCFMGDSGSTLLGFAVAWMCLMVSQTPVEIVAPVTTLWVVALPMFDILWSVTRRILRGRSPMKPDHEHLHHLLLRAGLGVRGAFLTFVVIGCALAVIGLLLEAFGVPDRWSFGLLVVSGIGVVRLMYRADLLVRLLPASLRRDGTLDAEDVASVPQKP